MSSVNELNAIQNERKRVLRIMLKAISDFNAKTADKAEILGKHGYRNIPILFEQIEVHNMLWGIEKAIRHEEENP